MVPICFIGFNRGLGLITKIQDSFLDLKRAKQIQQAFRLNISETTR